MAKVLKFTKQNCIPCEQVTSWLNANRIQYESINPFDNPELAIKFKVKTVPTVLILDGDVVKERIKGFNPDELQKHLLEFIF